MFHTALTRNDLHDAQGPEGLPGRAKVEEERALDVGRGRLDPQVVEGAGREHAGVRRRGQVRRPESGAFGSGAQAPGEVEEAGAGWKLKDGDR